MEIDSSKIIAAVVTGIVAIGAAIYAHRKTLEKTKFEHSLKARSDSHQHKLNRYSIAFEITEKLSKRFILVKDEHVNRSVFLKKSAIFLQG
ncbi:hypothetical protein Acife_2568 [Acidithiobacillus ferrivorans SS3]|uniref:Uncharacterized protein n=1 Tax=Acidithiobacillus ferrivorans SS3 TaxID=743299 RepID=G0JQL7_9PROT|nr:hypothetical protein [Acidithiobacillus ferrivorans]AEM48656.1 hypothetical protein Acife_2568 [Acidithiobacillus ferrivorans SS3]OFA15766.1 hypothetical protein A4U49_11320 [Acidithiobacillus ferrivorans]